MKKIVVLVIMLLMVVAAGMGQTKPVAAGKKPVSQYMRKIGILYLETIKTVEQACTSHDALATSCKSALEVSESEFKSIEDRVDITLSQPHAAGDKSYWALLKYTKDVERVFLVTLNGQQAHLEASEKLAKTCLETLKISSDLPEQYKKQAKEQFDEAAARWQSAIDVPFPEGYAKAAVGCVSAAHSIALRGFYTGRTVDVSKDEDCSFIQ